jgi:hypothetical protein
MKTMKLIPLLLSLIFIMAFHGHAGAQYHIPQSVFGNGGTPIRNGSYCIRGTVGQSAIGVVNSPSYINEAGFWYQSGGFTDEVESSSNRLPTEYCLEQNYPNPFNPTTTIQYGLPEAGHVRLVIYDALGRSIKTLVDAQQPAGQFNAIWDGITDQNQPVAAGIYFCHLEASGASTGSEHEFMKVIKLALIK